MFGWLRRRSVSPPDPAGYSLPSDLWVDRPEALERLSAMRTSGELSDQQAAHLEQFIRDGFTVLRPAADPSLFESIEHDVDRLWNERPWEVAYAYDGPAYPMAYADAARERRPRSRIHDIHSVSEAALSLYLHPELFAFVRLVLGHEPVAFQSLYFQFGSQQIIHRDPVVVPTGAPGHLIAAWAALEDIDPRSGALLYVPGSHRLPYFEFEPGQWQFDAYRMTPNDVDRAQAWDREQCRLHGLEPVSFTPRQGEVLIWHASLMHGGGPVESDSFTRRSFVIHYSSRDTYTTRAITVNEKITGPDGSTTEQPRVVATETLIERSGCTGLDNPMRGFTPTQASVPR